MASVFMMPCVKTNFYFLMTGVGKGLFNIFTGTLLLLNVGSTASTIMGYSMIASGLVFIFLSKFKNMSDDEMIRALSLQTSEKNMAKGAAKKLATDNKEVIAKVAYDNREVIGNAYMENQNNQRHSGY